MRLMLIAALVAALGTNTRAQTAQAPQSSQAETEIIIKNLRGAPTSRIGGGTRGIGSHGQPSQSSEPAQPEPQGPTQRDK